MQDVVKDASDIMHNVLEVGIALTAETNKDKLFDMIIEKGMGITGCDAGTLYLCEDETLRFKNMITLSQGVNRGANGEVIDLPAIPFVIDGKINNVSAYSAVHGVVVNIQDVYNSSEFDFSGPKKYDALTGYRTKSMLVIPLKNNENDVIGVLQLMNAQDSAGNSVEFDKSYEFIISALASQAAIAVSNMRYVQEIKMLMHSFVQAMATAIDERTPYNGSHTRKVTEYTGMLIDYINKLHAEGRTDEYFDNNRKEQLQLAANLHDIGKMIVPLSVMNKGTRLDSHLNEVLLRLELIGSQLRCDMLENRISLACYEAEIAYINNAVDFMNEYNSAGFMPDDKIAYVDELSGKSYIKRDGTVIGYLSESEAECLKIRRGTLTDDERRIMESHVSMTAKILSKVHFSKYYAMVPGWAASHHEMLDGSGYPNHLKGDELSLETRILAVVDIYDALTSSDRPYKEPMPKDKAFAILYGMAKEGKLEERLVDYLSKAVH